MLLHHVEHILSVAHKRMWAYVVLHIIFVTVIVLSVITYALPSFAEQLSIGDKARLDSLFRKAFRREFC